MYLCPNDLSTPLDSGSIDSAIVTAPMYLCPNDLSTPLDSGSIARTTTPLLFNSISRSLLFVL